MSSKLNEIKELIEKELIFFTETINHEWSIEKNEGFREGIGYILGLVIAKEKVDKAEMEENNNKYINAFKTLSSEEVKMLNDMVEDNNNLIKNNISDWEEIGLKIQSILKSKNISKQQICDMIKE